MLEDYEQGHSETNAAIALKHAQGLGINFAPKLPDQRLDRSDLAEPEPPAQIHELLYGLLRDENKQVIRFLFEGLRLKGEHHDWTETKATCCEEAVNLLTFELWILQGGAGRCYYLGE